VVKDVGLPHAFADKLYGRQTEEQRGEKVSRAVKNRERVEGNWKGYECEYEEAHQS
jgi:hypothetical protein